MSGPPIVDAKISVPPPHRWALDRVAARAELDRGQRVGITVVAAGPGYLERQLVESWGRLDPRRRMAWLSLDAGDDPVRLLVHALASVRAAVPDFVPEFDLDELVGSENWQVRAADAAAEALGALTEPLAFVLDGVHRLTDPRSRRGLETLIRYRPEPLRVIVLTRDDAAIDLAGSTMSGSVVELRESDLALDVEQTRRLLSTERAGVTWEEASAVHEATGGWPAGVALAAACRSAGGSGVRFDIESEPVRSYLRNRVLGPLDDDLETFFLQVAPIGFANPDLAAHITGRNDAGRALDRLAELHLLSDEPRERPGWRSFPPHLARFAQHESRSSDDAAARARCRAAARWCWERELLDEAMTAARCAGAPGLMAEILLEHHYAWSAGGQAGRVRVWCAALLQDDPNLVEAQLAGAWASVFLGDDASASSAVALLEAASPVGDRGVLLEGELAVLRAHLARRRGEMDESLRLARAGAAAADRLRLDFSTPYRGALPEAATLHVGLAALWAGELDEAVSLLELARAEPGWASQAYPAIHGHLAVAHWLLDQDSAFAHAATALTHVRFESLGAGDLTALAMALVLGVEGAGSSTLSQVSDLAAEIDEPCATVLAACGEAVFLASKTPAAARDAVRRARNAAEACRQPGALRTLVARVAAEVGADRDPVLGESLTEGEQRVLRMLSGSLTEREIAAELHLSHNTVRTYRRRLYRKLGFTRREDVEGAADAMRLDQEA